MLLTNLIELPISQLSIRGDKCCKNITYRLDYCLLTNNWSLQHSVVYFLPDCNFIRNNCTICYSRTPSKCCPRICKGSYKLTKEDSLIAAFLHEKIRRVTASNTENRILYFIVFYLKCKYPTKRASSAYSIPSLCCLIIVFTVIDT